MTTSRLPKPFTPAELAALEATPVRDDVRGLMTFFHETGMRSAEALSITASEARSWPLRTFLRRGEPACVRIIGKGDKERVVLLTPKAVRASRVLLTHPSTNGRAGFMVPFGDRWMRELFAEAGSRAGVDHHAHRYRHTYVTEHVESGTPIDVVADMAGHSSVDITRLYYAASVRARARAEKRRRRAR